MCGGKHEQVVSERFAETKVNVDAAGSFLMNVVYVIHNALMKSALLTISTYFQGFVSISYSLTSPPNMPTFEERVQDLPAEIYNHIYDLTFVPPHGHNYINVSYRPPAILQVSRATRTYLSSACSDKYPWIG